MKNIKTRGNFNVNIRKKPTVRSEVNSKLEPNQVIHFLDEVVKKPDGLWYKTNLGWVREDVVYLVEKVKTLTKVTLFRLFDSGKSTIGVLTIEKDDRLIFTCKTLELTYEDNQQMISAIPTGLYEVEMTYSPRFEKNLYLVKNVPNRSGVRLHSANFYKQLHGCIALGSMTKDINSDSELDIIHSGKTINEFESLLNNEPFLLEIKNTF